MYASFWTSVTSAEALRERDGEQEGEEHLHAGERDAQLVEELDQLAVDPLLIALSRLRHRPESSRYAAASGLVRLELVLQLAADAGEDLGDARLADAEHPADLGTGELLHVHQGEDVTLAVGEPGDRAAHGGVPVGAEQRRLRVELAVRRLDRLADLDREASRPHRVPERSAKRRPSDRCPRGSSAARRRSCPARRPARPRPASCRSGRSRRRGPARSAGPHAGPSARPSPACAARRRGRRRRASRRTARSSRPWSGSKRSIASISATRPDDARSSSSQCAGSSRTLRDAM